MNKREQNVQSNDNGSEPFSDKDQIPCPDKIVIVKVHAQQRSEHTVKRHAPDPWIEDITDYIKKDISDPERNIQTKDTLFVERPDIKAVRIVLLQYGSGQHIEPADAYDADIASSFQKEPGNRRKNPARLRL